MAGGTGASGCSNAGGGTADGAHNGAQRKIGRGRAALHGHGAARAAVRSHSRRRRSRAMGAHGRARGRGSAAAAAAARTAPPAQRRNSARAPRAPPAAFLREKRARSEARRRACALFVAATSAPRAYLAAASAPLPFRVTAPRSPLLLLLPTRAPPPLSPPSRPFPVRHAPLGATAAPPPRRPPRACALSPHPPADMRKHAAMLSFGDHFALYFSARYPHIFSRLRADRTKFAANVFLFRYDSRLSMHFVRNHIDSFSRSIADASGKSVSDARRLFTLSVEDAARTYFEQRWHNVSDFVNANASCLTHLRMQNTKLDELHQTLSGPTRVPEVDPILLMSLHENQMPVVLFIYAHFCSVCKAVRPVFEDMARAVGHRIICVALNGPKSPDFKHQYNITSYPTLIRFDDYANFVEFPKLRREMNLSNLLAFANGDMFQHELPPAAEEEEDFLELTSPRRAQTQWRNLLRRQGIDQLDDLVSERSEVLNSKIDEAIHCGGTSCDSLSVSSRDDTSSADSPLCILLGGGMGAGKTTVKGMIFETTFWKKHGANVVVVEADAFKLSDPLFQVLQSVTPLASRIVHKDSMDAAEQLFLQAVNTRRDLVFDGTMSWCEYAKQTIDMLRDPEYEYERGPGYVEKENGDVSEIYWVRSKKRPKPVAPYRVELIGVTTDPEIAVMRGIVRQLTTGRGVPVPNQLKSHALFSRHFETYIDWVDSAYLFDTTLQSDTDDGLPTCADQLIAIKSGMLFSNSESKACSSRGVRGFQVRHAEAYSRFVRKKFLNTNARSVSELYQSHSLASRWKKHHK